MKTNNIQITFDLLGEIVKFNKVNFIILDKICQKFDYHHNLLTLMKENIVDSNVFLRSLLMGFEKLSLIQKNELCYLKIIIIKEIYFQRDIYLIFLENSEFKITKYVENQEKKWLKIIK